MIIGINGKIGAGKDTVGTIIQGLLLTNKNQSFEIKKFAGKMKQIAAILTGIPVKKFEDQEFKTNLLDVEWGTIQDVPLNAIPPFADMQFNVMMSVREFLQKLGTEAMREGLHKNVWVNALFVDYKESRRKVEDEEYVKEYPNWIITDLRFPNELDAVEKRHGITIRVTRPVEKSKNTAKLHSSETALDKAVFDYEIINDGTMEELVKKVREVLIEEKLI
jgi:hypothetical protein